MRFRYGTNEKYVNKSAGIQKKRDLLSQRHELNPALKDQSRITFQNHNTVLHYTCD
jgi:hypothetical protein